MESSLPFWITAIATSSGALVGLWAVVRKPFGRIHGRFDGIEGHLRNIDKTLGLIRQSQETMTTLVKPLLTPESAEVLTNIIERQRFEAERAAQS